ncbi:hypothetical protein H310_03863 [Aphanomyces invadans]|uniref:Fe2OG dioxygenase domain-containing protein n=1 Tax=Aphanomyces invadans TaxID=157072 RepID=A0A024UFN7_9STRA|nr:hypothetical protein H310_03863 [Aphanomyces invadans]ETW04707.1 hypothetical protein H310_03863 [Aphanomyces invadans]|eukprot:XP_008866145.1 hypothetical protein H310_03863 [Aphanomyces invadans]
MPEPSVKKIKTDTAAVLHPDVLGTSAEARRAIRGVCAGNAPFPHYQIPVLCTVEHMRKVHTECVQELQSTFKETDLFKLYQTIDLGNLKASSPLAKKLPALMQLRNALYTSEFRQYMADITGCGPLTDKVDCAANVYMTGCHLLPHDDVIGTRCISYVIYLSDPDDEWTAADGGALELYPQTVPSSGIPALVPTAFALPTYNSLALFPVAPGVSFHSVQEVYADKPRLSIQGWYHQDGAPDGVDAATAKQVAAIEAAQHPFVALVTSPGGDDSEELTETEMADLSKFINPIYLKEDTLEQVQEAFQQSGSIQLQDFLTSPWVSAIDAAMRAADSAEKLGHGQVPSYTAGYDQAGSWTAQGPLFLQRYLRYTGAVPASIPALDTSCPTVQPATTTTNNSDPTPGQLLAFIQTFLVQCPAFIKWVSLATGVAPSAARSEVRRFRPGLDYTLAHHAPSSKPSSPILDVVLCFCNAEASDAAADDDGPWTTSGYECYVRAEDDGIGDVAVSTDDNEDDDERHAPVQIPAQPNTLSLVVRDTSTMKFVKFVTCREPGSRWDVNVEFELPAP